MSRFRFLLTYTDTDGTLHTETPTFYGRTANSAFRAVTAYGLRLPRGWVMRSVEFLGAETS